MFRGGATLTTCGSERSRELQPPLLEPSLPLLQQMRLCVDMQRIFAHCGIWETPWMERVLPAIVATAELNPSRNVFTRFITPRSADERPGRWRQYFKRWERATRDRLAPEQLDLIEPFARMVPPGNVLDKPGHSAFAGTDLAARLQKKAVDTVIVTGAETDVCVLSTVLSAVELGFRTVVVEDALCTTSDEGHDALMTIYRTRYSEQIDLVPLSGLPDLWRDPP